MLFFDSPPPLPERQCTFAAGSPLSKYETVNSVPLEFNFVARVTFSRDNVQSAAGSIRRDVDLRGRSFVARSSFILSDDEVKHFIVGNTTKMDETDESKFFFFSFSFFLRRCVVHVGPGSAQISFNYRGRIIARLKRN